MTRPRQRRPLQVGEVLALEEPHEVRGGVDGLAVDRSAFVNDGRVARATLCGTRSGQSRRTSGPTRCDVAGGANDVAGRPGRGRARCAQATSAEPRRRTAVLGGAATDRGIADVQRRRQSGSGRSSRRDRSAARDGTRIPLDQVRAGCRGVVEIGDSNFGEARACTTPCTTTATSSWRTCCASRTPGTPCSASRRSTNTAASAAGVDALCTQRGQPDEVTNGLPPRSVLHLRLFGERDYTDPDQSHYAGTLQVRRKKCRGSVSARCALRLRGAPRLR